MTNKQLSRREREKLDQRNRILTVALPLFTEEGYQTVSMHEIARQADCAIGTVYSHFENKEALYSALVLQKAGEHHKILKEVLSQDADKLSVIRNYIAAKGAIFVDSLAIFRLYFAEWIGAGFNLKVPVDNEIQWLYDDLIKKVASVIEDGIREKVFLPLDPYDMALALEGTIIAFIFRGLEDPEHHPYADNIPLIIDLFLSGCAMKKPNRAT